MHTDLPGIILRIIKYNELQNNSGIINCLNNDDGEYEVAVQILKKSLHWFSPVQYSVYLL